MDETRTPTRRPARTAPPRYRATVGLTYPATEEAARGRQAGNRDHDWAKANAGDPVPAWVVEMSPGTLAKGRVELVADGAAGGEE